MFESPADSPGLHWFVILRNEDTYEIFDSLGVKRSFVKKHFPWLKKVLCVQSKVQPKLADTCGHFCIYFAINRLHNLDMRLSRFYRSFFSFNKEENSREAVSFVEGLKEEH